MLFECDFDVQKDENIRALMWRLHHSAASTQAIVESCFAHLRDCAQRQSKSAKFNPYVSWLYATTNEHVAKSGMEQCIPTDLDWNLHSAKRGQDSEERRLFSQSFRLEQTKMPTAEHVKLPTSAAGLLKTAWRNSGPLSHYKSSSACAFLLEDNGADFANVNKAWCATVLERQGIFFDARTNKYFLSFGFYQWCALGISLDVCQFRGAFGL